MNRTDVTRALAMREDMTLDAAERCINSVLEILGVSLSCGEKVTLHNFGRFEPKERAATTRKNPRTGEPVEVPPRMSISFHPSKNLIKRITRATGGMSE